MVGAVSDLTMADDTLAIDQNERRRPAHSVGDEALAEGIDRHAREEGVRPAGQERADRLLVLVADGESGQAPAPGQRQYLRHRTLAGGAPGGPEEQQVGLAPEVGQ